jgi:RimJ/RimL family protein N-acetyltransferase
MTQQTQHAVTIRLARDADFDVWLRLLRAVAAERCWIATEPPVDEGRAREAFASAAGEGFMLLATHAGSVVGSLGAHPDAGRLAIGMFVDATMRGRGVGTLLLDECVRRASTTGAHKLTLEVWPHNTAARRLYECFGFVEEGRLRAHHRRRNGELWDSIVMGLVLDPRNRRTDAPPHGKTEEAPCE